MQTKRFKSVERQSPKKSQDKRPSQSQSPTNRLQSNPSPPSANAADASPLRPSARVWTPKVLADASYNPFEETCPVGFRDAMDAIFGLPFGGSLAFLGG